jgi:hypothetical protein
VSLHSVGSASSFTAARCVTSPSTRSARYTHAAAAHRVQQPWDASSADTQTAECLLGAA